MIENAGEMAAFVRVVEANGFSAAAPALGLTPSAVSKLVTRLEARLGVRLLQRTTRALHLTAEGETFFEAARRIVNEIEQLESRLSEEHAAPSGLLRVTTSLAFATHQLAPVISEFLARYPRIELDLLPTDRVIDVVEEGIDVAIRIGRLADTSFMARRIGVDKRLICASPDYLARHGTPKRPQDLVRHRCVIHRGVPYLNRWAFRDAEGGTYEIEAAGSIAVSEGEAQLQLALQGVGIVRLTRLTVAHEIRAGRLVSLFEADTADPPLPIHAVYPHRQYLAPKVPAFVNFLIEKFTPPPWEI